MVKEETFTTKEEWLKHRRLGGSDSSVVMGVSKWGTKTELYDRLVNNYSKQKNSSRMEEGTKAESHIRELFKLEYPQYEVIYKENWLFTSDENEFLTLTPDSLIKEKKTGRNGGLEIKDVELRTQEEKEQWLNGFIPPYYFTQLVHYMIVKKDIVFMLLNARLKFFKEGQLDHIEERCYFIERRDIEEQIAKQKEKELEFINNYVIPRKRPELEFDLKGEL